MNPNSLFEYTVVIVHFETSNIYSFTIKKLIIGFDVVMFKLIAYETVSILILL